MRTPALSIFARRGDRLFIAERNAVILYAGGAKEAAAKALGWKWGKGVPAEDFADTEIERIRRKAEMIAGARRRTVMRTEEPDRLDEREAEPPRPPEEERVDERVEEAPPTPPTPPRREPEPEEPEDSMAA